MGFIQIVIFLRSNLFVNYGKLLFSFKVQLAYIKNLNLCLRVGFTIPFSVLILTKTLFPELILCASSIKWVLVHREREPRV
jgi:hypothetical protein